MSLPVPDEAPAASRRRVKQEAAAGEVPEPPEVSRDSIPASLPTVFVTNVAKQVRGFSL